MGERIADIIAYPRTSTRSSRQNLYFMLERLHWTRVDLFILGDKKGWLW